MWFENVYRRHLCDMHIEDWSDDFLRDFSPEKYLACLKAGNIQNAMLYFHSHVGHCYYPTQVGHMHSAFRGRETMMRDLAAACRREGIYVTGYYSLIHDTWAHDTHPQWRLRQANGKSRREDESVAPKIRRYGLCCPNNPEYRAHVFAQMAEINDYFAFDGMFFDMPFWPHPCFCEHCQKRWAEEVGGELPREADWDTPRGLLHEDKRREWMGEFVQAVTKEMKRLRPGVSVEHNFAQAVCNAPRCGTAESVNEACDYAGGDLYGGILEQSFTCKFYRSITKNQPFEYMFSRCTPGLSCHTVTKSPDQMTAAVSLTAAHHGATLVIDAIDLKGTLDQRVYQRIGQVFSKEIPYERYFRGDLMADVGVYFSLHSKFHRNGRDYSNQEGSVNTVKTMIGHNIPVGVTGGFASLAGYKVLVASYLTEADAGDEERLEGYVRNGGTLYFSGAECPELLRRFLGARLVETKPVALTYMAPQKGVDMGWFNADYPLPFTTPAPMVAAPPEGVLATLTLPRTETDELRFASIHSNPPMVATSHPALISKPFGKGKVVWSALPLEINPNEEYRQILLNLLGLPEMEGLAFRGDAPEDVELVAFQEEDGLSISAVTLSEQHTIPLTRGFPVSVRCEKPPRQVLLLPDETPVSFTWDGSYVHFSMADFHIMAMYRISL